MSCTTSLAHLPFFLISAFRYLFNFYQYLFSIPHMNFVILNTIIIVLIFLSRQDTTRSINSSAPAPTTCQEAATEAETEKVHNEEHIVVDSEHPVGKMQFDGSNAEMEAGKMIRPCRFRRTQSEKLKGEHNRLAPGTILRRPETVVASGDDERASTSVDQVDSHADAFIAKQKRIWLAEKMAEKGARSAKV